MELFEIGGLDVGAMLYVDLGDEGFALVTAVVRGAAPDTKVFGEAGVLLAYHPEVVSAGLADYTVYRVSADGTPVGWHGGWVIIEGARSGYETFRQILEALPPSWRHALENERAFAGTSSEQLEEAGASGSLVDAE